ncbi:MAG: hypothetical protein ACTSXA_03880 [Candidatus Heimdallarchaeota archaeon]
MTTWQEILGCLSTKGVPAILILLLTKENGVNISQIIKEIPSIGQLAISNGIMCLVLNGLVTDKREKNYNQRIITLTVLGKKVSQHILAIKNELFNEKE